MVILTIVLKYFQLKSVIKIVDAINMGSMDQGKMPEVLFYNLQRGYKYRLITGIRKT